MRRERESGTGFQPVLPEQTGCECLKAFITSEDDAGSGLFGLAVA